MNLRIFIAVAVPEEIKSQIRGLLNQIQPLFRGQSDMRWVAEDNWHFTVSFLGYEPESAVPLIEKSFTEAPLLLRKPKIEIQFEKLVYGPNDRPGNMRRMIWLTATPSTSHQLARVKDTLEGNLKAQGVQWSRHDYSGNNAHLTLARFSPVSLNYLPKIEQSVSFSYQAAGLDLMESHLRRTGAVYEKLFGVDF